MFTLGLNAPKGIKISGGLQEGRSRNPPSSLGQFQRAEATLADSTSALSLDSFPEAALQAKVKIEQSKNRVSHTLKPSGGEGGEGSANEARRKYLHRPAGRRRLWQFPLRTIPSAGCPRVLPRKHRGSGRDVLCPESRARLPSPPECLQGTSPTAGGGEAERAHAFQAT